MGVVKQVEEHNDTIAPSREPELVYGSGSLRHFILYVIDCHLALEVVHCFLGALFCE